MPTTTFTPTDEQLDALERFRTGKPLALQAGAGTGKTSTLLMLAEGDDRRGQYLAFNKAIVEDARQQMPHRVSANTAHSLAFRTHGAPMKHRLDSGRLKSEDMARRLNIGPLEITTAAGRKRLAPGFLAGYLMRAVARFCQSADEAPTAEHFPYLDGIDLPNPDGTRRYDNQREVRAHLLRPLAAAWADLCSRDGMLRYTHDCYLKQWQLSLPVLGADYIMLDEAQDTNPVLLDVFWRQAPHAQLVAVGDDCQAIYEWRGAVNALGALTDLGAEVAYLSQSFRFGQPIADVANRLLGSLGAPLRLTGAPALSSVVTLVDQPDCVLTRTNAEAMRVVLEAIGGGRAPHVVGGGAELVAFAKAALALMSGERTYHPELACFDTWGEVKDYVAHDQLGDELRLLVDLMDEYGPRRILHALEVMPSEADADVVVSTAHKAKGREWDRVRLAGDFPDGTKAVDPGELRLLYVAVTRARRELDITDVGYLNPRVPAPADAALVLPHGRVDTSMPAPAPGSAADLADRVASMPDPFPDPDLSAKPCPSCGRTDVRLPDGTLVLDSDHLCPPRVAS